MIATAIAPARRVPGDTANGADLSRGGHALENRWPS
jgi:hypothetical protein